LFIQNFSLALGQFFRRRPEGYTNNIPLGPLERFYTREIGRVLGLWKAFSVVAQWFECDLNHSSSLPSKPPNIWQLFGFRP
jgi:hypothetical protein